MLLEQITNNNRIYFHGERPGVPKKDHLEVSKAFCNCVWLTTDPVYAVAYARNRTFDPEKRKQYGFIYECILKKGLNIFNPRNKMELKWLEKNIYGEDEDFGIDLSSLQYIDWSNGQQPFKRERIVDIIRKKYDGFTSWEIAYKKDDTDSYPSVGIFDPGNIKIIKIWDGGEFILKNEKVATTLDGIRSGKISKRIVLEQKARFKINNQVNFQRLYEKMRFTSADQTVNCLDLINENEVNDYIDNLKLIKTRFS